MKFTKFGALTAAAFLSANAAVLAVSHPAGAEDHGANHTLVSVVNSSTDVESTAKISMRCSASTGRMSLTVSGINTLDANGNSFLAYFNANGVLPNVGWQLGSDAGNIVITQNSSTKLWAGNLTMKLPQKANCSKGTAFVLNDQPFATGALKITGVVS